MFTLPTLLTSTIPVLDVAMWPANVTFPRIFAIGVGHVIWFWLQDVSVNQPVGFPY